MKRLSFRLVERLNQINIVAMNPSTGDTLNIKPHNSAGRPAADNDEISAARARIADMADPHSGTLHAGESVSLRARQKTLSAGDGLPPVAAPVSPAAQAQPAISLPQMPAVNMPAMPKRSEKPTKAKGTKGDKRKLPSPVKPILSAVAAFVLLMIVFKSQVLFSQLKYLTNKQAPVVSNVATPAAVSAEPTISIPKINVNAPVVYEPSIAEPAIQKALVNGVVHYGTSVKPGQNGNSVIVGHSSNDWWEPGNYKFVFVLLDKVVVGDQFSINYQSRRYVYEVTSVKVVEPTDLSVLAPTPNPTVTLITCTPPGTSWKRLIVQGKQISPEPGTNTTATTDATGPGDEGVQLPGSAPSIGNQFSKAWDNLTSAIGKLFGRDQEPTAQPTTDTPQSLPSGL